MSSISEQPSGKGELAKIKDRLRRLETRRVLQNATIGSGGVDVIDDGAITFLPDAGAASVSMALVLDSGDEAGLVQWSSGGQPAAPAHVRGYSTTNNDVGIEVTTADPDGDGHNDASLTVDPYAGVALRHGFPIGSEAHAGVTAQRGAISGTPYGQVVVEANDGVHGGVWIFDSGATSATSTMSGPNGALWAAPSSVLEWRAQQDSGGSLAYIPVRASSFPTSSSREVKEAIADLPFDPLEVVEAAPVQQWRYRAEHAKDPVTHFGPMAEDLPTELTAVVDDLMTVDTRDLVGVLWAAVAGLAHRVAELEGRN